MIAKRESSFRGRTILVLLAGLGLTAWARSEDDPKRAWNFESDTVGKIAQGFTAEVGVWEVARDQANQVLYQKARNEDAVFNIALVPQARFQDLDLSVRLKPVAGEVDRGGGVVWRAKDKKNYYVCRYNPLEDNFRVYKIEAGKRTMLKSAKTPGDDAWHALRVTMTGPKIACYLDGRKLLEAEDGTFQDPGMIGLWTKADAQTYFDELTAGE